MSLPMMAGESVVGALNLYAAAESAFGEVEAAAGQLVLPRLEQ